MYAQQKMNVSSKIGKGIENQGQAPMLNEDVMLSKINNIIVDHLELGGFENVANLFKQELAKSTAAQKEAGNQSHRGNTNPQHLLMTL